MTKATRGSARWRPPRERVRLADPATRSSKTSALARRDLRPARDAAEVTGRRRARVVTAERRGDHPRDVVHVLGVEPVLRRDEFVEGRAVRADDGHAAGAGLGDGQAETFGERREADEVCSLVQGDEVVVSDEPRHDHRIGDGESGTRGGGDGGRSIPVARR